MSPISSKTTVAQLRSQTWVQFRSTALLPNTGQFQAKRRLRRVFWRKFWATVQLRTVFCTGQFKAKRQLRSVSWGQFRATARLRTVFWTSFSFLRNVPYFKQNDSCAVAQSYLGAISINSTVAHGVLDKFKLFKKWPLFQAKRQLRSVIWGKFLASGKLCTAFFRGFGFLTIRVNLKQNDSCADCFDANFEKQDSCARCFKQVLAC